MIKKKKNFDNYHLNNLQTKIKDNVDKLCDFDTSVVLNKVETNSCFDFYKTKLNETSTIIPNIDNNKDIPKYKSLIVDINTNSTQRIILENWFDTYIKMYNATIEHFNKIKIIKDVQNLKQLYNENKKLYLQKKSIDDEKKQLSKLKNKYTTNITKLHTKKHILTNKTNIDNIQTEIKALKIKIKNLNIQSDKINKKYNINVTNKNKENNKLLTKLSWQNIRTYYLKNIRDKIQLNSNINKEKRIRIHVLDTSIKLACASYKSCIANYLNGNIKKFRIKFWRLNKNNKILEIEKESIKNNKIFFNVFGDFKLKYNNKDYELDAESTVKILHNKTINKYYLLVSKKIEKKETKSKKYIAIDQGIKPFIACRTNDELISMGKNTSKMIGNYLKRIDNINNAKDLTKEEKSTKCKKYYLKLNNKVDEIHWKIIKNITTNYGYVIIGDLNITNVTKKESKLDKKLKRIGLMMKISKFRNRLEYKCLINKIKIEIINEAYTSKVCSKCGYYKKDLGGDKIYKCNICKKERDRDYNSTTNMILLKM